MALFAQQGIKDVQTNKQLWIDEFNSIRANPTFRLVGKTFEGSTKDTSFWTETVTGSGTAAQTNGSVVLQTHGTANSTVQYQTTRIARWVPGQENCFRDVLRVGDTGAANNIRNWGPFDVNNGFFFQLNGTALNVVSRKAGSDTVVAQGSWNGNAQGLTNAFTLDTNFHVWEIKYTYADVHFYIDHNIMHTLKPTTSVLTATMNFPVTLQNNNSGGGTADVTLETGVSFISRIGNLDTDSAYKNIAAAGTNTLKIGAGRLQHIVINQIGLTATITIYDNTVGSGTKIASIVPGVQGSNGLTYDMTFYNGLTIVTTGTTVDITVAYE